MQDLTKVRAGDQYTNVVSTETQLYYDNVNLVANCIEIEFFNQGNGNIYVNGRLILPFQSWSVPGYPGEFNKCNYKIQFESNSILCVTRKLYSNL